MASVYASDAADRISLNAKTLAAALGIDPLAGCRQLTRSSPRAASLMRHRGQPVFVVVRAPFNSPMWSVFQMRPWHPEGYRKGA
jgi:hypothetical protein